MLPIPFQGFIPLLLFQIDTIHLMENHLSFSQMKFSSHFLLSGGKNPKKPESETPNLSQLGLFLLNPIHLQKNPWKIPFFSKEVFHSWRNQ